MGLRSEIQTDIGAAFDGDLADAVKSFTIAAFNRGTYDPTADEYGSYGTPVTSRGVFGRYFQQEILNSNIEPSDVKLIVLQNELSMTPKIGDQIVEGTDEYRLQWVEKDPADTIWKLTIRKVKD